MTENATTTRDMDGKPVSRVVLNDISARKEAEAALEVSEEKFRGSPTRASRARHSTGTESARMAALARQYSNPDFPQVQCLSIRPLTRNSNSHSNSPSPPQDPSFAAFGFVRCYRNASWIRMIIGQATPET
jgi:hypothetical protein